MLSFKSSSLFRSLSKSRQNNGFGFSRVRSFSNVVNNNNSNNNNNSFKISNNQFFSKNNQNHYSLKFSVGSSWTLLTQTQTQKQQSSIFNKRNFETLESSEGGGELNYNDSTDEVNYAALFDDEEEVEKLPKTEILHSEVPHPPPEIMLEKQQERKAQTQDQKSELNVGGESEISPKPQTTKKTSKSASSKTENNGVSESTPREPLTMLIDGHSLLYRSHFANKNLTLGATFGFIRAILKLIEDFKPTHVGKFVKIEKRKK